MTQRLPQSRCVTDRTIKSVPNWSHTVVPAGPAHACLRYAEEQRCCHERMATYVCGKNIGINSSTRVSSVGSRATIISSSLHVRDDADDAATSRRLRSGDRHDRLRLIAAKRRPSCHRRDAKRRQRASRRREAATATYDITTSTFMSSSRSDDRDRLVAAKRRPSRP